MGPEVAHTISFLTQNFYDYLGMFPPFHLLKISLSEETCGIVLQRLGMQTCIVFFSGKVLKQRKWRVRRVKKYVPYVLNQSQTLEFFHLNVRIFFAIGAMQKW